jgi:hypothetical protein
MLLYGLVTLKHAVDLSIAVCDVLGHGLNNTAVQQLLETSAVETNLGNFRDPTERYAGSGATQVDEGTFKWLKEKFTGKKEEKALFKAFGFTLSNVTYPELELSPLLAFAFTRLRYLVLTDQIPKTLAGRAAYWKANYNTRAGDGEISDYLEKALRYVPVELIPEQYRPNYR